MEEEISLLSENLGKIKDAVDDIRETLDMPNVSIEELADAVIAPPSGTIDINSNGIIDVAQYSDARVNVTTHAYQVKTISERDSLTDMQDEDICVVLNKTLKHIETGQILNKLIFVDKIIFNTAITKRYSGYVDNNYHIQVTIDASSCNIRITDMSMATIKYTSSDGIIYTKSSGVSEYTLSRNITISSTNDMLLNCIYTGGINFDGIFTYNANNHNWGYTNININTKASDILIDKEAYTSNGIITGTLGYNIASNFLDNNALIYEQAQAYYDTLEPRVLTDNDKSIDSNIKAIPVRTDGTVLLDMSNVTDASRMFSNHKFLSVIPLLNTSNLTSMFLMFTGCSSLKTIALLDTSNVTNMQQLFNGCTSLETIPVFDTAKVTNMNFMFANCSSLTSVPLLNTTNVTGMAQMFGNCTALTDASLDNILQMCINATSYTEEKTLVALGFYEKTKEIFPVSRFQALTHYQDFVNAGWTIGYE